MRSVSSFQVNENPRSFSSLLFDFYLNSFTHKEGRSIIQKEFLFRLLFAAINLDDFTGLFRRELFDNYSDEQSRNIYIINHNNNIFNKSF